MSATLESPTGCVYLITSPSGRQYIGATCRSATSRWRQHCRDARYGLPYPIQRAIRKHGEPGFEVGVLVYGDWDTLDIAEAFFIQLFGTLAPRGYNLRAGGNREKAHPSSRVKMRAAKVGLTLSSEHRARMSASLRDAWCRGDRKVSPANLAKMVAASVKTRIGRSLSAAHKEKCSVSLRGRTSPMKGRRHSTETRARIGAAQRGRVMTAEAIAKRVTSRARNHILRQWSTYHG